MFLHLYVLGSFQIVAISSMAKASDNMGLQRALGSSYFTMCSFDPDVVQWFLELEGRVMSYRSTSFQYVPKIQKDMEGTLRWKLPGTTQFCNTNGCNNKC